MSKYIIKRISILMSVKKCLAYIISINYAILKTQSNYESNFGVYILLYKR